MNLCFIKIASSKSQVEMWFIVRVSSLEVGFSFQTASFASLPWCFLRTTQKAWIIPGKTPKHVSTIFSSRSAKEKSLYNSLLTSKISFNCSVTTNFLNKHNFPILEEHQTQSAMVLALPREWAHQDDFNETLQTLCEFSFCFPLLWIRINQDNP